MNRGARVQTPDGPGRVSGPQRDRWLTDSGVGSWWVTLDSGARKCFWLSELSPLVKEVSK